MSFAAGIAMGLASLAALLLSAGCGLLGQPKTRVVLITLDTLRYDGVFQDGEGASRMSRLWSRAQGGARFSRFYAATSSTQPTHATMFTALHPWEHHVTRNGQVLSESHDTLPELFKRSGYETHAVIASFPLSARFGFAQGFDSFSEEFSHGVLEKWKRVEVPERGFFALGETVTERAIEAIDRARGDLQFFWFHYFDPHSPYGVTHGESLSKRSMLKEIATGRSSVEQVLERARRLYASDLGYLDTFLERLLGRIEDDADDFATHVLVVSDHGESFGERGSLAHGSRLSEVEIHVPAFLLSPGIEPSLREDVAGAIDVAPTLLALAGRDELAQALQGRDLSTGDESSDGAWGMRQTFRTGRPTERRLDGRDHRLPNYLFFAVDPLGGMHRGNRGRVISRSRAFGPFARDRLLARFAELEEQVRESEPAQEVDAETEAALQALGYAP